MQTPAVRTPDVGHAPMPIQMVNQSTYRERALVDSNFVRARRSPSFKNTSKSTESQNIIEPVEYSANQTSLEKEKLWLGYVDYVGEETFFVNIVDENDEYQLPIFKVEFNKNELSEQEQELLMKDSIVKWETVLREVPEGKQVKSYKLKLVDFPSISEDDLERARVEAKKILERIQQHETTSKS